MSETTGPARMPDDIAAAIEKFDKVVSGRVKLHQQYAGGPTCEYDIADAAYAIARAALDAAILSRLTAAEAERDEAVARMGLIKQQMGYRVEAAEAQLDAALARAERMEKAIRDYLDGNYPNPRNHRPGKCKHGIFYWEECGGCDCEHFEAALAAEGKE